MNVVIVTGLSGAGRSRTVDWFEDQNYYCIDNMPPALIRNFIELGATGPNTLDNITFGTDIRSISFFSDLVSVIDELRELPDVSLKVIFIDASTQTLVKRYNETRRSHPLGGGKATAAIIEEERELLRPIKDKADLVIDTTGLKVAELFQELDDEILGGIDKHRFKINLSSFGFKYGIPGESDLIIDMRFLPNPYYVPSLKRLTGNNKKIQNYVLKSPLAQDFIEDFHKTVKGMIPGYINEGKYHLNIAFGCTGGHHRSVTMANEFAKIFKEDGIKVSVTHRDLDLMGKGR
ncbi:MAG: RNase adapter RapZ [Clostridiales bacterium]|nr:RNase adapter RapZ [Candidatus Crickella merdequi]